jgi:predicted RNase H-like HicB family nuclease
MDQQVISFTAVYLKGKQGYVGFIEELPGVNSHGQTIEEAREILQSLTRLAFEEERAKSLALLEGKDVVRESFQLALPGV